VLDGLAFWPTSDLAQRRLVADDFGGAARSGNSLEQTVALMRASPTVAFTADGRGLVLAASLQLRVFDVETGSIRFTGRIRGGANSVAFHATEARAAITFDDGSIGIYDTAHWDELLTVRDHDFVHAPDETAALSRAPAVAGRPGAEAMDRLFGTIEAPTVEPTSAVFDSAGLELVSGWSDGTIRLHCGRPLTAPQEARRILEAIPGHSVSEELVKKAASASVRATADVAAVAERMARDWPEDPSALSQASWSAVEHPGASADELRLAQSRIERALRYAPDKATWLNTRAMVMYRRGAFADALAAVEEAMTLRNRPASFDLLVATLARLQLGQIDQAKADLARLHALKRPSAAVAALIKEADALAQRVAATPASRTNRF